MTPGWGRSRSGLKRVQELVRTPTKKAKASVSVSAALLEAVDGLAGGSGRSAIFERALRHYLRRLVRRERHSRELALLNAAARSLNAESDAVLADQATDDPAADEQRPGPNIVRFP